MTYQFSRISFLIVVIFMISGLCVGACGPIGIEASGLSADASLEDASGADEDPSDVEEGSGEVSQEKGGNDPGSEVDEVQEIPATGDSKDSSEGSDEELSRQSTSDPEVLNPLTGLPVEYPEWLYKRPVMVAISNFPPKSIPHTGESYAAMVFELFQGVGMTRNLAIFYGDYAEMMASLEDNQLAAGSGDGNVIGPVRSGRVVFEDVKKLFPKALLITAGASSDVKAQLSNRTSVYSSDPDDINSTGVGIDQIEALADHPVDPEDFVSLIFNQQLPEGGDPATFFRVIYNLYNQIGWEYDPEEGVYLRSHDKADGTGELFPETDRLTGEQLGFENVAILWAQHRYVTETIVEMNLLYVWDQKGLLFRDGRMYPVKWSTRGGKLAFESLDGDPISLKPGSSFFEVVSWQSTWDPEKMILRFHEPPRDF